ncbi:hypothetical protein [Streptomyces venezuelae]|uniref:hypothetical protein n=1 Tax=Streptomyces venezuelae TaxID=54571 RepID=UPI001CC2279D|nr:hypothetical protein [Streptomyces venezuelae]
MIESLTVVAADPSSQRAWVDEHGVATDEIVLDFDHAFRMVESLVEGGEISREVRPDLQTIDAIFAGMSGRANSERWSREALAVDPGWTEARELARRVLVDVQGEWNLPMPAVCIIR